MARPRNNEQGPTATQRMEQAFWDTLEHKPFNQITIKDITQAAKVNHNTFYYHYDNIEDLALHALPNMELQAENILFTLANPNAERISKTAYTNDKSIDELRTIYHLLRLVLTSESPRLVSITKSHVLRLWPQVLGLAPEECMPEDAVCFEFAWGGLTAVVGSEQATTFDEYIQLFSATIAPIMTAIVKQIFSRHPGIETSHAPRKEAATTSNPPKSTTGNLR